MGRPWIETKNTEIPEISPIDNREADMNKGEKTYQDRNSQFKGHSRITTFK